MHSIAFDLDGTLLDIRRRDYRIYADILNEYGYSPLDLDTYWGLRRSRYNIFNLLAMSGLTDETESANFIKERQERMENIHYLNYDTLFPCVKIVLSELRSYYDIYIVTTRFNIVNTERQIVQFGLNVLCTNISITGRDKSSIFSQINGLKYVVGDTENDICAAQNACVKAIAITTGIRNRQFLETLNPDFLVDELTDLRKIVI